VPEAFDEAVLRKGARESRAYYKSMFRDVDAAIMMPGANTSHPAYLAMQDWLKDDLTAHQGRRTIHFHWIENGSAYPIAGQPLPSRPDMDGHYQRALLQTDYKALADIERRFAEALNSGDVHITSPVGTDLRFRGGNRPANLQDGDASAARTAQGKVRRRSRDRAAGGRGPDRAARRDGGRHHYVSPRHSGTADRWRGCGCASRRARRRGRGVQRQRGGRGRDAQGRRRGPRVS
jgi:Leucyl aminopeptidase (aminopeptidase T)